MIHLLRTRATPEQLAEMLQALEDWIKVAVDIQRDILAGGGKLHAECEAALLADGSRQEDIWGATWEPDLRQVICESLINIRPRQNNRSMPITDPTIRDRVVEIVRRLLEVT
jgi:hypothetical protein